VCGRYASFREAQDLADAFAVSPEAVAEDVRLLPPSWNVAPTDAVRVVVEREPHDPPPEAAQPAERSLRLARWGLVPGWAKDPSVGARMINARVESLATKPAFRRALVARRCLVPAEGYYEWKKPDPSAPPRTPKQPFWIHAEDGAPLAFAGLYEFWRDRSRADDDPLRWLVSMTIVTGGPSTDDPALAEIHDRAPVILDRSLWDAWLDPRQTDPTAALGLLAKPPGALVATPVSTAVNHVGTNGPELIEPVEPA
jgi:putative SOS response-associated peptidase YedK